MKPTLFPRSWSPLQGGGPKGRELYAAAIPASRSPLQEGGPKGRGVYVLAGPGAHSFPSFPRRRESRPMFRNSGMTLIECLCVLAVLTILISVMSQTFISTMRLSAASDRVLDRVRYTAEIRDAFSTAVREAGRVVDGVLEFKTGGDCLVLELSPAPDTAARRYAVLRRMDNGRFARLDVEEHDGVCKATYLKTYALWTMAIRFNAARDARLVSMEMDVQNAAQSPNRPNVVYHYSATMRSMLGGEGRV